jgi:hypothetical protein
MSFYFKYKKEVEGKKDENIINDFINFNKDYPELETSKAKSLLNDIVVNLNSLNQKAKLKSKMKKGEKEEEIILIGGLNPEVYLNPPKTFQDEWVFYIPRCDFTPQRYSELIPNSNDKTVKRNIAKSYGKLLPESYYYGILKTINNKFYIDLDLSLINDNVNEKIQEIYRVAVEKNNLDYERYPISLNLEKYFECLKIIIQNPDLDWETLIPQQYYWIFGGKSGFSKLYSKDLAAILKS